MATETADAMIVRSAIDLARDLGLRVVAEGIEDAETYEALRRLGCGMGQGFHIGRPMAPDALVEWLQGTRLPPPALTGGGEVAQPAR
jgi:EAL domain-containing protein (putative c-di-GMP-specific phosphodiesterase class I)